MIALQEKKPKPNRKHLVAVTVHKTQDENVLLYVKIHMRGWDFYLDKQLRKFLDIMLTTY